MKTSPRSHIVHPRSARDSRVTNSDSHIADLLADELRRVIDIAKTRPGSGTDGVLLDRELHGFRVVLTHSSVEGQHAVTLSPRELEIARMIGKGLPNKMIADVLDISTWTVGTHLRRIFAKLGVTSRAAMVAQLLQQARYPSAPLTAPVRSHAAPRPLHHHAASGVKLVGRAPLVRPLT
jgi:DNA-binding CsgD family transcriptional regulator